MELFKDPKKMQKRASELKRSGQKIGFVPTMGALHNGHLSLVDIAKKNSDVTIMSIYLNPTQFGAGEDLDKYPSNLERDLDFAKKRGVDIVFCPTSETVYPEGYSTYVNVENMTNQLCGASREGHFRGVTTIVLKLFNTVLPDVAIFGQKDYQQLQVIKRMVKDLNLDVEIVGAPIIREEDGVAMSSRNEYLIPEERRAARSINQSLLTAHELIKAGEKDLSKILKSVQEKIEENGIGKIDYVKITDPETLEDLSEVKFPALLAVAARFGSTRLIDNTLLTN